LGYTKEVWELVNSKIMIVDDEIEILELVALYLERENYEVTCINNANQTLEKVKEIGPDLLILDILLSGVDGIELCRDLRKFTDIPILFISGKREDVDKVIGLSAGGDDYITKPFSPIELVARVKAHLRRNHTNSYKQFNQGQIMKYDALEIDLFNLTVHLHGSEISISSREFKILTQLAKHPGRIFSIDDIYQLVWGTESFSDARTVMVHISNLRKKIEENPSNPSYIITLRGIGYKFNEKKHKM
jgi:DNA-binding response OmpR family regulator